MAGLLTHLTILAFIATVMCNSVKRDPAIPIELVDAVHKVKMGVSHADCDDAKVRKKVSNVT